MNTIQLTDENNTTFNLPETWEDVSVEMYKAILDANTTEYPDIAIMAAVSGLSEDFWKSYNNYPFFVELLQSLQFIATPPNFKKNELKSFQYKGKQYEIEKDGFYGVVAQYEDMKAILRQIQKAMEASDQVEISKDLLQNYSVLAKIYAHPIVSGEPYNYTKAVKSDLDKHLSIMFVMPLAFFLIRRLNVLKVGTATKSRISRLLGYLRKMVRWKSMTA